MAYHCDKCRKETDVLYPYGLSEYCKECFDSMYDVIVYENGDYFVCDECGQECDELYRDGNVGFCTDCIFG